MKNLLTYTLLSLLTTGAIHAQTAARDHDTASVFGSRHAIVEANYIDFSDSNSIYGGTLGINIPITTGFDAVFKYNYSWEDGHTSRDAQSAFIGVNSWHKASENIRLFIGGDFGYTWGRNTAKDDWLGRLRVGAEYTPISRLSLLAYVSWSDGFDHHIDSFWSGTTQVAYWLTDHVALTGRVSWLEGGNAAFGLGALFKF